MLAIFSTLVSLDVLPLYVTIADGQPMPDIDDSPAVVLLPPNVSPTQAAAECPAVVVLPQNKSPTQAAAEHSSTITPNAESIDG